MLRSDVLRASGRLFLFLEGIMPLQQIEGKGDSMTYWSQNSAGRTVVLRVQCLEETTQRYAGTAILLVCVQEVVQDHYYCTSSANIYIYPVSYTHLTLPTILLV